jgi:hypothetical protein
MWGAHEKVTELRRHDEFKWTQYAKIKHVQEGGNNTKYFHLIENGKHQRKKIFQLDQDDGTVIGHKNLKTCITKCYNTLLGSPPKIIFP